MLFRSESLSITCIKETGRLDLLGIQEALGTVVKLSIDAAKE